MSKLIDTSVDAVGDIVLSRADAEIARIDAAGNITTKGAVNGGSLAYLLDLSLANTGPVQNVTADLLQLNAPVGPNVVFPTGYAGNDVVEPSIIYDVRAPFFADATGANGYEYVMCLGGYSGSNALYENPNLWVSHDGDTWVYVVFAAGIGTPTAGYGGVLTPVIPSGVQGDGNISDPTLVRGPDGSYFLYWNQFLTAVGSGGTGTGGNNWSIKVSKAASLAGPWSTPVTAAATVQATSRPASMSAFWDGYRWQIYAVEVKNTSSTSIMRYTCSTTDLTQAWTLQTAPTLPIPSTYSATQVWWHLSAYRMGHHHLLLIQDSPIGASSSGNLWAVWSKDGGTTWTIPSFPFMIGSTFYRPAMIVSNRGSDIGLDIYYGVLSGGGSWQIHRTFASFTVGGMNRYGGLTSGGLPVISQAVVAARVPIAPYVFGDAVRRADSTTVPGTADSGQAYTLDVGVIGVLGNQLYPNAAGNNRAALTLAGVADGVYMCEFSAVDPTNQFWFIARFVNTTNYVRLGNAGAQTTYALQSIVAGVVSGTETCTFTIPTPPAAGDVVALVCNGSTIYVYVNGTLVATALGWTTNKTGSGIGVQSAAVGTVRWRNLCVRPLIGKA